MLREKISPKIAGIFGILGILVAFTFIAIAIHFNSSWWNWFDYTLSHLGNIGDSYKVKVFSLGLIIAGFMEIPFGLGLHHLFEKENKIAEFGIGLTIIGAVGIIIQGFFPSGTLVHDKMGGVLYLELAFGMIFIGIGSLTSEKQRPWGALLLALVTQLILIFILNNQIPGLPFGGAINETIAVSTYSLFSIIFGVRLLRTSKNPLEKERSYKYVLTGIIAGIILLVVLFSLGGI